MASNRGWNDPPALSFSGNSRSSINRLQMMKKRVPIYVKGELSKSVDLPSLPIGPSQSFIDNKDTDGIPEKFDSIESFSKVESSLLNVLCDLTVNNDIEKQVEEDVKKRIDILKKLWLSDQLHKVVQSRMLLLCQALEGKDFKSAWAVHQGLIVNFTHDCSNWLIGVKALIVASEKNLENTEVPGNINANQQSSFLNPSQDT